MEEDQIRISRVFNAPKETLWKYWTDPELIKKWWGPEGFYAPSAKVDFQVGGKYVFAMHGPKGTEFDKDQYSAGTYREIIPLSEISATDYFSDDDGDEISPAAAGMDPNFPREMEVTTTFEDVGTDKTRVSIIYARPEKDEEFQALVKSGLEQGWNSSLNKLEKELTNMA